MKPPRNRTPIALAGLALVAVTAVACGSEDGSDPSASDTGSTGTAATSGSASTSPSEPTSDSASGSATPSGDPVPSPIINKAVKDAIADDFPALVPSGVPAGWSVTKATYTPKRGGQWRIELEDPNGAPVTLAQSKKPVGGIVNQYLPGAQPGGQVDLGDYGTGTWDAYSAMNAAALAKSVAHTSVVVVGPDQDTVVTLVQELLTAEDAGSSDGG